MFFAGEAIYSGKSLGVLYFEGDCLWCIVNYVPGCTSRPLGDSVSIVTHNYVIDSTLHQMNGMRKGVSLFRKTPFYGLNLILS